MPGQVVTYCPMTARFVLLYSDGSSDGVPANEIEDHVPLLRQLPSAEKRNWKKRRAENCREERQEPTKRCKSKHDSKTAPVAAKTPSASDVSTLATRFVQDTLWALTTVLDVDDETIKTLLVALDNRNEQPRAALARYAKEGGLEAMSKTLRVWACGTENSGKEDNERCCNANRGYPPPARDAADKSVPRRPATNTSPRARSLCDQHLRELMSGKCKGVVSPKPCWSKEPKAPSRWQARHRNLQHTRAAHALNMAKAKSMQFGTPELVDLTGGGDEEIEANARKRLHFGLNSTIVFDKRESVDVFRLQMRRTGHKRMNFPKQNSEAWKSALKSC